MLVTVFLHSMPDGMTRELATSKEICEYLSYWGWTRIEKVVVMDFREIERDKNDGTKERICPDF